MTTTEALEREVATPVSQGLLDRLEALAAQVRPLAREAFEEFRRLQPGWSTSDDGDGGLERWRAESRWDDLDDAVLAVLAELVPPVEMTGLGLLDSFNPEVSNNRFWPDWITRDELEAVMRGEKEAG